MNKNERGFTGLLLILLLLIVLIISSVGYFVLRQSSKSKPSAKVSTEANGFLDTPECASFNNYVNDRMGLPADFQLEMRMYVKCGNFISFGSEPQTIVYGYKVNKTFQDVKSLQDYVSASMGLHGWQKVGGQENYTNLTATNLGSTLEIIAFNPATIAIRIASTTDYQKYPEVKHPSPPQKLLTTDQQLKSAPFNVYVPTVFPYLPTTPAYKAEDVTTSSASERYLDLSYYAHGLLISYSSIQVGTAEDYCKNPSGTGCALWATTPKGYKVYVYSNSANKDNLKDVAGLHVDIDNTDLLINGLDTSITKAQLIQIVDSMQKIN